MERHLTRILSLAFYPLPQTRSGGYIYVRPPPPQARR